MCSDNSKFNPTLFAGRLFH